MTTHMRDEDFTTLPLPITICVGISEREAAIIITIITKEYQKISYVMLPKKKLKNGEKQTYRYSRYLGWYPYVRTYNIRLLDIKNGIGHIFSSKWGYCNKNCITLKNISCWKLNVNCKMCCICRYWNISLSILFLIFLSTFKDFSFQFALDIAKMKDPLILRMPLRIGTIPLERVFKNLIDQVGALDFGDERTSFPMTVCMKYPKLRKHFLDCFINESGESL